MYLHLDLRFSQETKYKKLSRHDLNHPQEIPKPIQTDLRCVWCVNIKNINVYPSLLFHYPKQISFPFSFSLEHNFNLEDR